MSPVEDKEPDAPDPFDSLTLDESFVANATIREPGSEPLPRPSKASLREVKREAKARKRQSRQPGVVKRTRQPRSTGRQTPVRAIIVIAVLSGLAWACLHYLPMIQSNGSTVDPAQADPVTRSSASAQQHDDAKLNPLEGTAAAAWPTGGAGITLPTPRPVGEYSREVVRHAYAATRRYLVAAMLTDDVLYHGKVQPVLDGFPDSDQLAADYGDPHDDKAWSFIATRFRPGVYTPVGHTVKVRGWMKAVERNSELQVRYSYAAAYPMRSTRQTDANPALVVIRREGELRFLPSASGSIVPWPGRTYVLSDHSVCGRHWSYPAYTPVWMDLRFHAGDDQNVGGKSIDISDPNQSARRIHECFTNSGGL